METFSEFEKKQAIWLREKEERDLECVSCPQCGSQWFTEIPVSQYKAEHHVVVGQRVPPKPGTIPYLLLKCIVCEDLLEPRVLRNARDTAGGGYDYLLDTLSGLHDTREDLTKEKQLEEEDKDEVQDKEQQPVPATG